MYFLTNVITMLIATSTFFFSASTWLEYTYENGVQFEIKSLQSLRLSSFIVSKDIISVIVDQNFTMNMIGIVLESM